MTIPFFKNLYKLFSFGICLSTSLQAYSPTQELNACKPALLAQLNGGQRQKAQSCPLSEKLVYWLGILQNPDQFTPQELTTFLRAHSHWPQHEALCKKAEDVMIKNASFQEILNWFNPYPPQTPEGVLLYAKTLLAHNERTKSAKVAIEAWHTMDLTSSQEQKFLTRFGHLFQGKDHIKRLHHLLMQENVEAAKRLFTHVPARTRKIAQARIALLSGKKNPTQAMNDLKKDQLNDEGLLYEVTKWHRKKDNVPQATAILLKATSSPSHEQKWWRERNYIARELIEFRDYQKAYHVLKRHKLKPGTEAFADAEWLLGWLSLRFLNKPQAALTHFRAMAENVRSAISKARGGYWMGRTYEAMGKINEAEKAYRRGAQYKTTYYGQLAAAKVRDAPYPSLAHSARATADEKRRFDQSDLVKAAHILSELGEPAEEEVQKFLLQIASNAQTKGERELAVELAHRLTDDYVVWTAKKAGYADPILLTKSYPSLSIPQKGQKVPEKAFVLSLICQESRFLPKVKSSAGAIGLMQLMPQTAAKEAKRLAVAHRESKLYDPHHNMVLGSSHLSYLLDKFNQSYILTAAAYNAGHTPVARWLETFGDPRKGLVDVVDWIELIPYAETRDYVQRVLENITPYRSLEGKPKKTLVDDLKR